MKPTTVSAPRTGFTENPPASAKAALPCRTCRRDSIEKCMEFSLPQVLGGALCAETTQHRVWIKPVNRGKPRANARGGNWPRNAKAQAQLAYFIIILA